MTVLLLQCRMMNLQEKEFVMKISGKGIKLK